MFCNMVIVVYKEESLLMYNIKFIVICILLVVFEGKGIINFLFLMIIILVFIYIDYFFFWCIMKIYCMG